MDGIIMPGFYQLSEDEFDYKFDDFTLPPLSKERRYKHFDLPLKKEEREIRSDFNSVPSNRRFWPLLGYNDTTLRFTRNPITNTRTQSLKVRPIRFASHSDAAYLQEYAIHLEPAYEQALTNDKTSEAVLAYRRGGGTNIHHAKSLFDEIRSKKNCTVFAMDISGFFDSLDHIILRDQIASIINQKRLQGHHSSVWRNMTRYSWVETDDLNAIFGKKYNGHGRICTPKDFELHVQGRKSGLINTHNQRFGIPQGTPVSGLYANIYMRDFDKDMLTLCGECGGSYRRYSDDIAVVLPLGINQNFVTTSVEKILADYGLAISAHKTEIAEFENGLLRSSKPIQYLGFTFDGYTTLIRPSSLDAYRRKMKTGIHAKMIAAKVKGISAVDVYKRESLSRYTHLGKRRNFLTYVYKAANIMGSKDIRLQVKNHVTWFNRIWAFEILKSKKK